MMVLADSVAAIMAFTVKNWALEARNELNTLMQDTVCSLMPVRQQRQELRVRVQRYLYSSRTV